MSDATDKNTEKTADSQGGATFTQEDLDRIAAKVRAEERAKRGDVDKLQARLAELEAEKDARAEAEKTERQKEIDAAVKAAQKELTARHQAELTQRDKATAIRDALRDAGGDPKVAVLLTGEYEPESVEDIPAKVKQLLVNNPHFVIVKAGVKAQGAAGEASATDTSRGILTQERVEELSKVGLWMDSQERKDYEAGRLTFKGKGES